MAKKNKAPQINPQPAIDMQQRAIDAQVQAQRDALAMQEKYTPLATNTNLGVFGGTEQVYDPNTRTITSKANYNPLITQGIEKSLQQGLNFEDLLKTEKQDIQNIYQAPQERETQRTVENLFGELGSSGRYSSRGSKVLADTVAKANEERARVNFELGQQAEANLMNRIVNKFNLFYKPTEQVTGNANPALTTQTVTGAGQQGANIISNTGRTMADIYKGMADTYTQTGISNQNARIQAGSKPTVLQSLLGLGVGTLGQVALKRFG